MHRKGFIKVLSLLPLSTSSLNFSFKKKDVINHLKSNLSIEEMALPKRIAAVVTMYRKNSHAEAIVGKYLEGYNRDRMNPYPRSKVVSLFMEQIKENDTGRFFAKKYNVPVYPTVMDALTLGGDEIAVDGVLLIGEHGDYPMNEKEQKLYPHYEMFLKVADAFRKFHKSVPVYNDKHLSFDWRQAKRVVEISRELKIPMLAGSSVPVAPRIPSLDVPYGAVQKHAVAIAYAGLDVYGFHLLEALQCITERRKGGETGVKSVQFLDGNECWEYLERTEWVGRLFKESLSRSNTRKEGELKTLVKDPTVFIIEYNDGLTAATFRMNGLLEDFTVAVDLEGAPKPFSVLMNLQNEMPYHYFSCLVKNIEILFETGRSPYPVERTMLVCGMLDFVLESRIRRHEKIDTPELSKVRYVTPDESHFCKKGWGADGKLIEL